VGGKFIGERLLLILHSLGGRLLAFAKQPIILFLYLWDGVKPSSLLLRPFIGLLYHSYMIDGDDCGTISVINEWQGKPKYWGRTCLSAALFTTDLT
jgi:hypothetical protein